MIKIKENFLKFIYRNNSLLGIDIKQGFIRLVELSYRNHQYQLEYCANFTLEHCLTSEEEVIRTLKNILNKVQLKSKNGAIALVHSEVVTKEVEVNSNLSSEEIVEFLGFNIERYVSGTKDSISFDYQAIGDGAKENGCKTLQLVAVQEERADKLVNLLKSVNLSPKIIDLDIYALERAAKIINVDSIAQTMNDLPDTIKGMVKGGGSLTALPIIETQAGDEIGRAHV